MIGQKFRACNQSPQQFSGGFVRLIRAAFQKLHGLGGFGFVGLTDQGGAENFAGTIFDLRHAGDSLRRGAGFNRYDRRSFYGGGAAGYVDYPAMETVDA